MASKGSKSSKRSVTPQPKTKPSPSDVHDIVYFYRHRSDDPAMPAPGRTELRSWPDSVRAKVYAVATAVAGAPPNRFSGGGYWEAMHGDMTGWYEIRVDGPRREHFRLFCLLDYDALDKDGTPVDKPYLVIIDGRRKAFRTTLGESEYAKIQALGIEYRNRNKPRSVI
ncbi:hypothetical protein [Cryobacterium luteum]|uniref:Uncharacterized protein n=1 Tax=Cryobacterium luteum TaxID=1424661 RepID=A0A1H8LX91_9MICO|nr:hypothetical protein [Cryobacterium luteum]TFB86179.1 hypothetical protein E3O10_14390 [Cryobacterium luteum]SEO09711.1 hypothetical protein SAMN05216281_13310 [Cryobacterium luteum]